MSGGVEEVGGEEEASKGVIRTAVLRPSLPLGGAWATRGHLSRLSRLRASFVPHQQGEPKQQPPESPKSVVGSSFFLKKTGAILSPGAALCWPLLSLLAPAPATNGRRGTDREEAGEKREAAGRRGVVYP